MLNVYKITIWDSRKSEGTPHNIEAVTATDALEIAKFNLIRREVLHIHSIEAVDTTPDAICYPNGAVEHIHRMQGG